MAAETWVDGQRSPYAGFWRRAVACFIDCIVLMIPMVAIWMLVGPDVVNIFFSTGVNAVDTSPFQQRLDIYMRTFYDRAPLLNFLSAVTWWLYYAGLQSLKPGASIGMMVLDIRVTDLEGRRVSFFRATYRIWPILQVAVVGIVSAFLMDYDADRRFQLLNPAHILTGLSWLVFVLACIPAGFTPRKQGLHDLMAKCLVAKKAAQFDAIEESSAAGTAVDPSSGSSIVSRRRAR